MRLKFRKYTAVALIVAMVMASSISVWAEELEEGNETDVVEEESEESRETDTSEERLGEGNEVGVGEVEGSVETDIYQVVLPTVGNNAFDFIIDPQGLINKTNGAAYNGKTFEENSTLFFKRTDGKVKEDYCNTSDVVTITNMGSNDIDVSLHISISPESLGGIQLTGDREFRDDISASIYMALVDGKNIVPIGPDGITMDVTIGAAPEGAYEYGYDKVLDEYTYQLKENRSDIEFGSYSFQLTGAANGKGDWSQLTEANPQITVSWKIVSKESR